jgi:hypothetical protein
MTHSLTNILQAEFSSNSRRSKNITRSENYEQILSGDFFVSVIQAGLKIFVVGVIRIIIQIDGFVTNS